MRKASTYIFFLLNVICMWIPKLYRSIPYPESPSFPHFANLFVCVKMINNYIIYRFSCAWRYLDRHKGNPIIYIRERLLSGLYIVRFAAEFPTFFAHPVTLTHPHTFGHIFAYFLHGLDWILHGITIARDLLAS